MVENVTENKGTLSVTPPSQPTIHGYARCSTNEKNQDIDRQVRELKAYGATLIWKEYEHGDAAEKVEQEKMFRAMNAGDTIVVTEVSRLCRSAQQLCYIIDIVKMRHLRLIIIGSVTVDCRGGTIDPMTEAFLQMAGVFSQLELSIIRARVKSGMENAKAKGVRIGRPPRSKDTIPDSFYRYYPRYLKHEINISEFARLSELSRMSIYRYLEEVNKTGQNMKGAG